MTVGWRAHAPWRAALSAVVAALALPCVAPVAGASASRLVAAGTVQGVPTSDGRRLISSAGPDSGRLLAYDPRTRAQGTFDLGAGCGRVAQFRRTVTVRCATAPGQEGASAYALDTRTGARTPLPSGSSEAGTQWVEYSEGLMGGRPGARTFRNYRTGARASIDIYDDGAIDLDSPAFGYVLSRRQGNASDGDAVGTTDRALAPRYLLGRHPAGSRDDVVYAERARPGTVRLGLCRDSCDLLALGASRAAWVDHARPRTILSTDLRGGHRRTWRTPGASEGPLVVGDRFYTAVRVGRTRTYQVYALRP